MRRVRTLAALSAVSLLVGAHPARAAHLVPPAVDLPHKPAGAVTSVSIVPVSGHTEVVVSVTGAVDVEDFALTGPPRIVLDITGASIGTTLKPYDKVARGGITNVRLSQFRANIVRVVLDLAAPHEYSIVRGSGEVRISIDGGGTFQPWHAIAGKDAVVAEAPAAVKEPVKEPAAAPAKDSARTADSTVAQPKAMSRAEAAAKRMANALPTSPPKPEPKAQPKADVAKAEQPRLEQPKTEAPKVEAPKPQQPKPEQARSDQAKSPQPKSQQPKPQQPVIEQLPPAAALAPKAAPATPEPVKAEQTPAEPPKSEPARAEATKGDSHIAPSARRASVNTPETFTVTYSDADIKDVIAGFAAVSHRTIVAGKDVNGKVTAEIIDQPWDVAMRAILQAQGYDAHEDANGIIIVDSYANIAKKQASEPLVTQVIDINYVAASSLVRTVQSLLSKDCGGGASAGPAPAGGSAPAPAAAASGSGPCNTRGTVASDSATNKLLVTEVPSRMQDVLQYVRTLDVKTPQVSLSAKIIAVSRTATEQLGLSYDLGMQNTFFNTLAPRMAPGSTTAPNVESQVELGGDALAGVANAQRKFSKGSALNLIFTTALGRFSLTSFLDALKEASLADVQAQPSITTLDNREARILVGQEIPVRVIDASGSVGTPAKANVQFKETGIILQVTPHITNNRQIRMSIYAEQSDINIIGGDLGFITNKNNATTQVLVGDGETAVIGGLTQTTTLKSRSGIPFLVDLPLLGALFGQTQTQELKKDLLILITPRIIDDGDAVRPPGSSR